MRIRVTISVLPSAREDYFVEAETTIGALRTIIAQEKHILEGVKPGAGVIISALACPHKGAGTL